MNPTRLLMLLATGFFATGAVAADSALQSADTKVSPSATTPLDAKIDLNLAPAFRSSQLGLKPQSQRASAGMDLPYGLSYNQETKILLMPIDQKNEWGLGFNFDLNPARPIELAPASPPLGLQPKRAPGVMLQKRF